MKAIVSPLNSIMTNEAKIPVSTTGLGMVVDMSETSVFSNIISGIL